MGMEWLVTVVYCCRYVFCTKCFSEIQGDTVTIGEDLNASRYECSVFLCVICCDYYTVGLHTHTYCIYLLIAMAHVMSTSGLQR